MNKVRATVAASVGVLLGAMALPSISAADEPDGCVLVAEVASCDAGSPMGLGDNIADASERLGDSVNEIMGDTTAPVVTETVASLMQGL
jgi:hypothetical protein